MRNKYSDYTNEQLIKIVSRSQHSKDPADMSLLIDELALRLDVKIIQDRITKPKEVLGGTEYNG